MTLCLFGKNIMKPKPFPSSGACTFAFMTLDHDLFHLINQTLANPFFDAVLPIYREKTTWIPLYLLILFLLWREYGLRRTLFLVVLIAATLAVADQLAASFIKPWMERLRPCAVPAIEARVRELVRCGGPWSFPSNHATNHFALATLLALTWLRDKATGWTWLIYAWAASISLAQVYVGKHWPLDILAGAGLGTGLAFLGVLAYRKWVSREDQA